MQLKEATRSSDGSVAGSKDGAICDDPQVMEAAAYLGASPSERAGRVANQRTTWSAIAHAQAVHDQDTPTRWELEARLLAGESDAVIARKSGVRMRVVRAYHDWLFDVRERLGAIDWLMCEAVRAGPMWPCVPTEADTWRYMAAAAGPIALDVLIGDYLGRPDGASPQRHEHAERLRRAQPPRSR